MTGTSRGAKTERILIEVRRREGAGKKRH